MHISKIAPLDPCCYCFYILLTTTNHGTAGRDHTNINISKIAPLDPRFVPCLHRDLDVLDPVQRLTTATATTAAATATATTTIYYLQQHQQLLLLLLLLLPALLLYHYSYFFYKCCCCCCCFYLLHPTTNDGTGGINHRDMNIRNIAPLDPRLVPCLHRRSARGGPAWQI